MSHQSLPEREVLSKIFGKAIDFDRVSHNPCRRVERLVLRNTRARYFTHEEEERLMKVLTGTLAHIRPIVIVGIGTDLRPPSEIFNLRRSDVDFERNVLRAGTKTNEEREIPMSKAVREVLLDLYNRNVGSEYLFVSWRTGERLKEVKNGFRSALKLAGIKGASLYTMRHTFGTRLGEKGYTAYEVMSLMGHRDIKTSARYVHSTDGRKREAVESIWERSPHTPPPTNVEQPQSGMVNIWGNGRKMHRSGEVRGFESRRLRHFLVAKEAQKTILRSGLLCFQRLLRWVSPGR